MCVDFPRKILKSALDGLEDAADRAACWHHEEGLTDNELQPTLISRVPTGMPAAKLHLPAAVFF